MCRCVMDYLEGAQWCGVQQEDDDFPGGNHLQDIDVGEILVSALEA